MDQTAFNLRLGSRLKEARDAAGLSQDAAATALGLTRTAITQIEAGNRGVKSEELETFTKVYRQSVDWFFKSDSLDSDDVLVALLRSTVLEEEKNQEIHDTVNKYIAIYRAGTELSGMLNLENRIPPPKYELPYPANSGDAIAQGERTAEQERRRLNLGSLPVADIAALIDSQNIWVSTAPFPDSLSGLFLHQKSFGQAIIVNETHVIARKRFSYAHEYCHVLVDRESTASSKVNADDLIEKRANAFAAAFLLPADGLVEMLSNMGKGGASKQNFAVYDVAMDDRIDGQVRASAKSQAISFQDAALIAHRFGVSYQAAVYRLMNLNCVSKPAGDSLLNEKSHADRFLQVLGMGKDLIEKEKPSQRELRAQVAKYAFDCYVQDKMGLPKLREIVTMLELDKAFIDLAAQARKGL